jgi:hypothetical protein
MMASVAHRESSIESRSELNILSTPKCNLILVVSSCVESLNCRNSGITLCCIDAVFFMPSVSATCIYNTSLMVSSLRVRLAQLGRSSGICKTIVFFMALCLIYGLVSIIWFVRHYIFDR